MGLRIQMEEFDWFPCRNSPASNGLRIHHQCHCPCPARTMISAHDQHMEDVLSEEDFREESREAINPIKVIYYMLQLAIAICGFALMYYCITLKWTGRGGPPPDRLWTALLDGGISMGIGMLLYSVFGIVVLAVGSQALATWYAFITILLIFFSIGQIWWVQGQLQELSWQMSDIWDELRPDSKRFLQDLGKCCGYTGLGDRAVEPCKLGMDIVGCFPAGQPSPVMEKIRSIFLIALSFEMVLSLLLVILCIFLVFVHDPLRRTPSSSRF